MLVPTTVSVVYHAIRDPVAVLLLRILLQYQYVEYHSETTECVLCVQRTEPRVGVFTSLGYRACADQTIILSLSDLSARGTDTQFLAVAASPPYSRTYSSSTRCTIQYCTVESRE